MGGHRLVVAMPTRGLRRRDRRLSITVDERSYTYEVCGIWMNGRTHLIREPRGDEVYLTTSVPDRSGDWSGDGRTVGCGSMMGDDPLVPHEMSGGVYRVTGLAARKALLSGVVSAAALVGAALAGASGWILVVLAVLLAALVVVTWRLVTRVEVDAVLADSTHEEHEHLRQWVGRPVDPGEFDLALVNSHLQMVR